MNRTLIAIFVAALFGFLMASAPVSNSQPLYLYTNYLTLKTDLDSLAGARPNMAKVFSIGQSMEGNEVWCIEIANFSDPDYALEPAFYLDATHHGNEQCGTQVSMLFARFLLEEYDSNETAKFIVENRHVFITPIINPDGNLKDVRYNDNIVDLNRNYPHEWGLSATDQGSAAGSEVEVQNNMAFMSSHKLDCYLSLHTGSYDLVRPLCDIGGEYQGFRPEPDVELYDNVCDKISGLIGMGYRGSSGTGESIAWLYGNRSIFSILMEVSTEQFMPLTFSDPASALNDPVKVCVLLAENADKMCAKLSVENVSKSGSETVFTIRNEGFGPATNCTFEFAGNFIQVSRIGAENSTEVRFNSAEIENGASLLMKYTKLMGMKTPGGSEAGEVVVESEYALSSGEIESMDGNSTPGFELLALAAGLCAAMLFSRKR